MNLVRIATRIAEQTLTSMPVKHDVSAPLFSDESYEKDLAKLLEHAEAIAEGVNKYLESITEGMESDGSVIPEELADLETKRPEHAKAICNMLIETVCAPDEEDEGEEEPVDSEAPAPAPVPATPAPAPAPEAPEEEEEEEELEPERQEAIREISKARKHGRE